MNGQKLCHTFPSIMHYLIAWCSARFLSTKMRGAGVLLFGAAAILSAALPAGAAKAFGLLGVDIGNEFMKVGQGFERHVSACCGTSMVYKRTWM